MSDGFPKVHFKPTITKNPDGSINFFVDCDDIILILTTMPEAKRVEWLARINERFPSPSSVKEF